MGQLHQQEEISQFINHLDKYITMKFSDFLLKNDVALSENKILFHWRFDRAYYLLKIVSPGRLTHKRAESNGEWADLKITDLRAFEITESSMPRRKLMGGEINVHIRTDNP